ncbi:MAG TPA: hypothetical protein VFX25_21485 [Streptosporangiaceae bacterium]|nr:hypothetical protein [Streptosporangiaceae bacterium]
MANADEAEWDIEFYADENGHEPCRAWAEALSPLKRAAFRAAVETVLVKRGLHVVDSELGKALGHGLYELRLRQTAEEIRQRVDGLDLAALDADVHAPPEKILLRVFFCTDGSKIILLLSAYDKADDSTAKRQDREIANARKLLKAHQEAKKRAQKRAKRQGGKH